MAHIGGFISAPIKLASLISDRFESRRKVQQAKPQVGLLASSLVLLVACSQLALAQASNQQLRHKTHYLDMVPSSHFNYKEGRQMRDPDDQQLAPVAPQPAEPEAVIFKRSSALLSAPSGSAQLLSNKLLAQQHHHQPVGSHYSQLVSSSLQQQPSSVAISRRSSAPESAGRSVDQFAELLGAAESAIGYQHYHSGQQQQPASEQELQEKQHIQYHNQLVERSPPLGATGAAATTGAKCHKRTLNFCASVLPFNTTTFPNIIGDTNRFEVKRSLPFFGFLAKSSCNKRLDELLCLLLEPPCSPQTGLALPPCKKFCRLALEGCNEYIPATLALSSVFDCRQYPDSNEPGVCVNLAQGNKCAQDEFKCPDNTCIARK